MPPALDLLSLCLGVAAGAGAGAGYARQKARAEKSVLEEKLRAAAGAEERAALHFENLANRIFAEKSDRFKKDSREDLDRLLSPLKERLQEFQKKVDESFGQQAKEQFSLKREIENIVRVNERMTLQAEGLTKALKGDVKAQGNWGEVMLEKILEGAGLRPGADYVLQGADMGLKNDAGGIARPDAVVMLPEGKHIVIDAKVSLTSYERYCAAQDDAERAPHLKDFIVSVRAHVAGLSQRRYQDIEKLGAPDFVLLFMPVEGAYALAAQQDPELHAYAWDRKIAIVCPSTLFATLKTVASVWRIELQNRHALEIARQGGGLYDKVAGFVEDMQALGERLGAAQKTWDSAFRKLSEGPGNILKRTENLRALGVRAARKLPPSLTADEAEEAEDEPAARRAENG